MQTVELVFAMYIIGVGVIIIGILEIIKNEIKQKNISKQKNINNETEIIVGKPIEKKEKASLRKIINLIKDAENGGRKISRIHSKVENDKNENWKKDLKETKLALEVLLSKNSKKFKKELNKIING